jgi:hypothetical protein
MGWKDIMKGVGRFLDFEMASMIHDVSKEVDRTIDHAERTIEEATVKAIKASTVFILIFVGLIFALVGLSKYIGYVFDLDVGVGYLIIGATLLLLGRFAQAIR